MRVLVTGAARAIGRATVEVLAERGHEVVATAREVDLLEGLPAALALPLDVRDTGSVRAAVAAAGELDAVVNNAALTGSGPLESYPLERFAQVFDVNTVGPLRMAQAVVPRWRERGSGVLVNISSVQGKIGTPLEGPYAASKHALEAMSETLYFELGHFGIRVVIIEPGYIAPGMKHDGADHSGPDAYAELHAQWSGTDSRAGGAGRPAGARDGGVGGRRRDRRPGHATAGRGGCGRRHGAGAPAEPARPRVRDDDALGARADLVKMRMVAACGSEVPWRS